MAKSNKYKINNIEFKSQKALLDNCKTILNKYKIDSIVSIEDKNFLLELLKRHDEFEIKVGVGIDNIIVKKAPKFNNKCFFIIRKDGSITDFSYIYCVNNYKDNEPFRMFRDAARTSILAQINEYKTIYINKTTKNKERILCEVSNIEYPYKECHVDHIPPNTFDKIIKDFINKNDLDLNTLEYFGFEDNQTEKRFKDEELENKFKEYHKKHAKLRFIYKKYNLSKNKKIIKQLELF